MPHWLNGVFSNDDVSAYVKAGRNTIKAKNKNLVRVSLKALTGQLFGQ
jgi:hypothetical protein